MYCTKCGIELRESDKFCSTCGTPSAKAPLIPRSNSGVQLSRPRTGRKLLGVCAAVARYLDVDITVIRLIAVVLLFWPIPLVAAIAYLIAAAIMPEDPIQLPAAAPTVPPSTAPLTR